MTKFGCRIGKGVALITLIRRFEEGVALTTILSRRSWKGGDSDIISITAPQNPSFFVGTGGGVNSARGYL